MTNPDISKVFLKTELDFGIVLSEKNSDVNLLKTSMQPHKSTLSLPNKYRNYSEYSILGERNITCLKLF